MKLTVNTSSLPLQTGSQAPGLEGAPRSASHENRMTSVIPAAVHAAADGKEGSSSKL